jgi:hypothetical protein
MSSVDIGLLAQFCQTTGRTSPLELAEGRVVIIGAELPNTMVVSASYKEGRLWIFVDRRKPYAIRHARALLREVGERLQLDWSIEELQDLAREAGTCEQWLSTFEADDPEEIYRDPTVEVTGSAGGPSSRDAAPPPCRWQAS